MTCVVSKIYAISVPVELRNGKKSIPVSMDSISWHDTYEIIILSSFKPEKAICFITFNPKE